MTFYKDFNKDVKDLLTKNYIDGGKWKVESKFKGPKDTVFINPQGGNSGVSADIEYNPSCCGAKVKVNVNPALAWKLTASYEEKGHKVEVVTDNNLAYEVSYDGKIGNIAINDKLTSKDLESGIAYAVAKHCSVGLGATVNLKDHACKWTIGARYSDAGRLLTVQTVQLQKYLTGVSLPLTIAGKKVTAAAQVECGKGACGATVGADFGCILFPGNTARIRVTDKLAWAVAYLVKLPDNWKAAVSIDGSLKPGLTLTHE